MQNRTQVRDRVRPQAGRGLQPSLLQGRWVCGAVVLMSAWPGWKQMEGQFHVSVTTAVLPSERRAGLHLMSNSSSTWPPPSLVSNAPSRDGVGGGHLWKPFITLR